MSSSANPDSSVDSDAQEQRDEMTALDNILNADSTRSAFSFCTMSDGGGGRIGGRMEAVVAAAGEEEGGGGGAKVTYEASRGTERYR